jgi:superfamily I DNA and/or RNA helicase
MNFEDFRKDIEKKLNAISKFELQEYHYVPFSFGDGILAYQINGQIHKFVFDGRDMELTWLISKAHQKYFGAELTEFKRQEGLNLSVKELENGIKNSAQHWL